MSSPPSDFWAGLSQPGARELVAQPHPSCAGVFVGIDQSGSRHLLVRVPPETPEGQLLRTRGLLAQLCPLQLENEPLGMWADVSCLDPSLNEMFAAVADDLAAEVTEHPTATMAAVQRTLDRWRRFWGLERQPMTEEQQLGLFGELWFVDQWAPSLEVLQTWVGPLGNRHDFVSSNLSVEVKTARSSDGYASHRISSLDQLESPEAGELLLFSLQLIEDAGAGNSLSGIVNRIQRRLHDRPDLLLTLDDRLTAIGWTPLSKQQMTRTFRITSQGLYRVEGAFPRLTKSRLGGSPPDGVVSINYAIDMAACAPWLIARTPAEAMHLLRSLR